jgi:N6-adenosine-specific RNA methylase IME4
VIYCDLTIPYTDEIFEIPMSSIGEENSVVFVWTLPNNLGEAMKIIQNWGFKYEHCWMWNKAFVDEFTDNAEILIIASKGKPAIIKGSEFETGIEKPKLLKKKIYSTYGGSKVEMVFEKGNEGWSIWSELD